MAPIVLVSQSPRRKQILEEAGISPKVVKVDIEEFLNPDLSIEKAVSQVARAKVEAYIRSNQFDNEDQAIFIGADTIVVFEGEILGKPVSEEEARETLLKLSGKSHSVVTGYAVFVSSSRQWIQSFDQTQVCFKPLDRAQIDRYIATGEPMDKAGSYGIQGQAGEFVDSYEGDFLNVVGLPITKIRNELAEIGVMI